MRVILKNKIYKIKDNFAVCKNSSFWFRSMGFKRKNFIPPYFNLGDI